MSQAAVAAPGHDVRGTARQARQASHGQGRPGQGLGQARHAGLTAKGLAVWVTLPEGADCDPAVLARAAELVLGRALRCAPEAEVHFRPAAGAATSAVVRSPEEGSTPAGTVPEGPAGAEDAAGLTTAGLTPEPTPARRKTAGRPWRPLPAASAGSPSTSRPATPGSTASAYP